MLGCVWVLGCPATLSCARMHTCTHARKFCHDDVSWLGVTLGKLVGSWHPVGEAAHPQEGTTWPTVMWPGRAKTQLLIAQLTHLLEHTRPGLVIFSLFRPISLVPLLLTCFTSYVHLCLCVCMCSVMNIVTCRIRGIYRRTYNALQIRYTMYNETELCL